MGHYTLEIVMAQIIKYILLLFVQLAWAQFEDPHSNSAETPRRTTSNTTPTILSDLGDLVSDVDEFFGRQTEPSENAKEVKEQLYGRTRSSRSNYFGRIRENYRNLQRRVGSSLGIGDLSILSDFLGINIQNKESGSLVDVSLPFLPMKLSVSSKHTTGNTAEETSTKPEIDEPVTGTDIPKQPKSTDYRTNLKLGDMKIDVNSKSTDTPKQLESSDFGTNIKLGSMKIDVNSKSTTLELPRVNVDIKLDEPQKRSSRHKLRNDDPIQDLPSKDVQPKIEKPNEDVIGLNEPNSVSKETTEFSSRRGLEMKDTETEEDSLPSGRILGDVLYSESIFDKIMKRIIKDTKWVLDSDLSPSKVFERLNRLSQIVPGQSEKSTKEFSRKKEMQKQKAPSHTKSTVSGDREHIQESSKVNLRKPKQSLKPMYYDVNDINNGMKLDFITQDEPEIKLTNLEQDKFFLAFTPEGVPLKLRMASEVENPLKFLHETLSAANVALNIPIESYDDIEPVGTEVLQVGSGNGGLMARALYVDLSDSYQLKSLLRILRKFRSTD